MLCLIYLIVFIDDASVHTQSILENILQLQVAHETCHYVISACFIADFVLTLN